MIREVDINEISDGTRYKSSDTLRIACNDCEGCFSCCTHMEGLITIDPYDLYRLTGGVSGDGKIYGDISYMKELKDAPFETVFNRHLEFTVDRGVLIPVLRMMEDSGKCSFLSNEGRCSIHHIRPGICRLFPMGRIYEDGSFSYFLQKDECSYKTKTKVKLKNWLDTKNLSEYEKYISDWHYFIRDIQEYVINADEEEVKQINTVLIQIFFSTKYSSDFYTDFYQRLNKVKGLLS